MSRNYDEDDFDYDFYRHSEKEKQKILEAERKNELLVQDLRKMRENFAGIGTNKAKRRLNKLSLSSPLAKAVRLSLEIEDKSILAKDASRKYKEKIYRVKETLIIQLCELFREQNWIFGVQESDVFGVSHVIYFEIPECEQISWHFSPGNKVKLPTYLGKWDGKANTTLPKLEAIALKLLEELKK